MQSPLLQLYILILFIIIQIIPTAAFEITEVYPDTLLKEDPDEYFIIEGEGSLDDITISDGEGILKIPAGKMSDGRIVVAEMGVSYHDVWGEWPDYEIFDTTPLVPEVMKTKNFKFGNKQDEIVLSIFNTPIQTFSWPDMAQSKSGQIHYLENGEWDKRIYLQGQSKFEPIIVKNVSGIITVSPDCSRDLLLSIVRNAKDEILLNVYEFTDMELARVLGQKFYEGVSITVILDGSPVGGISSEEKAVIADLTGNNIPVYMMGGDGKNAPYRFDHAKYIVTDRNNLFLSTENFKYHSFPKSGVTGNRGWSVSVNSTELAEYFSEVFLFDLNTSEILKPSKISETISGTPEIEEGSSYRQTFTPVSFDNATVTTVLSPDNSYLVTDLINNATKSVDVIEAYIKEYSKDRENPYLHAIINAARRGVQTRVLLDSYYYNIEDENDNDEMVAYLNEIAREESIPLSAKLIDLDSSNLLKIHAKGVITEDQVLISSINWNENSPTYNREAGLIITNPKVISYLSSVYEKDWIGTDGKVDSVIPARPENDSESLKMKLLILIVILLIIIWARKLKKMRRR